MLFCMTMWTTRYRPLKDGGFNFISVSALNAASFSLLTSEPWNWIN